MKKKPAKPDGMPEWPVFLRILEKRIVFGGLGAAELFFLLGAIYDAFSVKILISARNRLERNLCLRNWRK